KHGDADQHHDDDDNDVGERRHLLGSAPRGTVVDHVFPFVCKPTGRGRGSGGGAGLGASGKRGLGRSTMASTFGLSASAPRNTRKPMAPTTSTRAMDSISIQPLNPSGSLLAIAGAM